MKLPNWARYCERCGTRVRRAASSAASWQGIPAQTSQPKDGYEASWDGSSLHGLTVNDAIKQELDSLSEPLSLEGLDSFAESAQRTNSDAPELTINDAIRQELDRFSEPMPIVEPQEAFGETRQEASDSLSEPMVSNELVDRAWETEQEASDNDAKPEPVEERVESESDAAASKTDGEAEDAAGESVRSEGDADVSESSDASEAVEESSGEEPLDADVEGSDIVSEPESDEGLEDADQEWTETLSDADDAEAEGEAVALDDTEQAYSDAESASDSLGEDEPDFWSTQQFEKIDVGEDDLPTQAYVPTYHRSIDEQRRVQDTFAHPRVSERRKPKNSKLSKAIMTAIAVSAILLSFLLTYPMLNWAMQGSSPVQQETSDQPTIVSKRRAKKIVKSLEGWWTTNRTFDGRYWRIKNGVLETYAADGNLTKKRKIKLDEIELAREVPEGLEGKGYFLHSISFFLLESDSDTLYAINDEGELASYANLVRTDEPSFAKDK